MTRDSPPNATPLLRIATFFSQFRAIWRGKNVSFLGLDEIGRQFALVSNPCELVHRDPRADPPVRHAVGGVRKHYPAAAGYAPLRRFLQEKKVRHILLAGYATDMCFCKTTAGYQNLSKDFNVFLVGDATLATFPSNSSPKCATNAAVSFAALDQLVTQVSWVKYEAPKKW